MTNKTVWIILGVVFGFFCCCSMVGMYALYRYIEANGFNWSTSFQTTSEPAEDDTAQKAPMQVPAVGATVNPKAVETRNTLDTTLIPNNDLRELAMRLKGIKNIPDVIDAPVPVFSIGDEKEFNALNTDTNENYKITAKLAYITPHSYFWIEDGVEYNEDDVESLAETFENKIYPTDREFFGSEWTPGIDGDEHLYIVYARGLGDSIAGLFSSIDSIHPLARPDSNGHESFFMSADNLFFGEEDKGTLAHEFQHMIHWYRDRNEDTWMNEGFSVLAEFLNGYDTGGFDELYVMNPDQQLTDWPDNHDNTRPHYGESFLFLAYFLDRFGESATKQLVSEPENGMPAIDKVLLSIKAVDKVTGKQITADDVFADWVVAMLLKDSSVEDGRFIYKNYPNSPAPNYTETLSTCPINTKERDVSQYGVDYIHLNCPRGEYSLNFQGVLETGVLAENPHSGEYAFWSNKGDESDMTLTQTFDFTGKSSPLHLEYWLWHDLETDYDYAYLEYSEDGESWTIIPTVSCTSENKSGNSYGCGWNAKSGGWKKESVDLSFLAGKKVQLRFEYITDAAVNGEGLFLDDIAIPEINYQTDFETDNGGWEARGFVRIQNMLPQTYKVTLIQNGSPRSVTNLTLDGRNHVEIPVTIENDKKGAVLVVSGTTRLSRQKAQYQFSLSQ